MTAVAAATRPDHARTERPPPAPASTPAYVLLGLPLALASFVVLIVGLALGVGLLVTVVGLPILAGTLYTARGLADIERLRLPAVLRQPRIRPHYRLPEPGASAWRRIFVPIARRPVLARPAHGILR